MVAYFCCVSPHTTSMPQGSAKEPWEQHGAVDKVDAEDESDTADFNLDLEQEIEDLLKPKANASQQNGMTNVALGRDRTSESDTADDEAGLRFRAPSFASISGGAIAANYSGTSKGYTSPFTFSGCVFAHVLLPTGKFVPYVVGHSFKENPIWGFDPFKSGAAAISSSKNKGDDVSVEGEPKKLQKKAEGDKNDTFGDMPPITSTLVRWSSGEFAGKYKLENWSWKSKPRSLSSARLDYDPVFKKPAGVQWRSESLADAAVKPKKRAPNLGYLWSLPAAALPTGDAGQLLEKQFTNTAAGEDRCQVVFSEYGFLFLAIFDGFGGEDASEYLKENLYAAVLKELKGLLVVDTMKGEDMAQETRESSGPRQSFREVGTGIDATFGHDILQEGSREDDCGYPPNVVTLQSVTSIASMLEDSRSPGPLAAGIATEGSDRFRHERILESLKRATAVTEERFLDHVKENRDTSPELPLVGSCLLIVVLIGDDLYTLSLGDSFAVVGSSLPEGPAIPSGDFSFLLPDAEANDPRTAIGDSLTAGDHSQSPSLLQSGSAHGSGRDLISPKSLGSKSSSRRILESSVESMLKQEGLLQVGNVYSTEREKAPITQEILPLHLILTSAERLTVEHNTSSPEEVKRVVEQHSDDPAPITRSRIKGKVKVTRCFGAGFLKMRELNDSLLGVFRVKFVGHAPYLSSEPDLRHHRLCPENSCLIISSDGLYQRMDPEEAVALVDWSVKSKSLREPAEILMEEAMRRSASAAGIPYLELLGMPVGDRRLVHDDLSVVVLKF